MPTPMQLFLALVFGSIGLGYLVYGRRQKQSTFFYTGIALMGYPYFVSTTLALITIGVALLALPRFVKF